MVACIALLERHVLAREQQGRRAGLAFDRAGPRDHGLDRVARAPDVHVGNEAQRRRLFHRLVRRAVFAEADGVVCVDKDVADFHQRRHAQRIAGVLGEHEEGTGVRDHAAMQRHAVGDG